MVISLQPDTQGKFMPRATTFGVTEKWFRVTEQRLCYHIVNTAFVLIVMIMIMIGDDAGGVKYSNGEHD
jgi:hypothetical protein